MSADTNLVERVRSRLVMADASATPVNVAQVLRDEGVVLGDAAILQLVTTLRSELVGAGALEPLVRMAGVTDVLVNGPFQVFIDRGNGLEATTVSFPSDASVRQLAQRLATSAGRRLDDASPCVDARLVDGTRLHAVIPPIASRGTLISLRIPRKKAFTFDELVSCGTLLHGADQWLRAIVAARLGFLISGGTGTGKTTVLSMLLGEVEHGDRVLIVEDSGELAPDHPHIVRLEARHANSEGVGEVSMAQLVRQALRMRPDRVVVGEVRGAEVVELLTALNTGHEGGCGTIHANSAADVPARLEALGLLAHLDRDAVHALIGAALNVVVHLHRDAAGQRRLATINVITMVHERAVCEVALAFTEHTCTKGPGFDRLVEALGHLAP